MMLIHTPFLRCAKRSSLWMHFLYGITVCLLSFIPTKSEAQKKQLVAVNKVEKIAFVDPARLRRDCQAFKSARERLSQQWYTMKAAYELEVKNHDAAIQEQLRLDSLTGMNKHNQIIKEAQSKKGILLRVYQAQQKKLHQEQLAVMDEYERKITLAIDEVVSKGGYTEVKAFIKNGVTDKGTDITDSILKKLN